MMKKYITKQSNIKGAGKGLFTKAPFKKGEVIGLAHVDDQPYLEIGHNHNHDEKNPTAFSKKIDNKRYIFASRDLNPGEEITTNYRLQPELEQPEDFQKKKGGMVSLPRDKPEKSKKFSRSLDATNRLFTKNYLFEKPKSRKNKVFDPHAKYYAEGGTYEEAELTPEEIEAYRAEGYTVDDNEYQDGGVTKTKLSDKEEKTFQKFYNTLPDNLQSDDDTYDIRGYWDSEGRPEEFNYDQPKDKDDGYYHANSINGNTGEYLKSPAHETFQHAVDQDRKIGWRPVTNVQGRNIATENESLIEPEAQSFLRNMTGPVTYAEGGSSDCPKGEYWNGTKCVKIPKNTRIIYHTDKDVYDKAFAAESDSSHFYNTAKSDFNKFDKLGDRFSTPMSYPEWKKVSDQYYKLLDLQKNKWHTDEYRRDIYTPNYTVNYKYKGPKSGLTIKPVGLEGFYREGYKFPRFKKPVIHNVYEEPIKQPLPTTRTIYIDCPPGSIANGQKTDITTPDPDSPGNFLRTITTTCDPIKEKEVVVPIKKPIINTEEVSMGTQEYPEELEGPNWEWDKKWHSFTTPRLNKHFPLGPLFNGKKKHNFSTPSLHRRKDYKEGGLHKLQGGGSPYYSYGNKKYIKKNDGTWFVESNGEYVPLTENVKARTAELNKNAKYNANYLESQAFKDKLRKNAGKMYIPENQRQAWNNYNDGPVNMVYPETAVIGPGGGAIGLGSKITPNAAGLGIKGLNKAMSYIPTPVSGALNAYFGIEGIKEFSDPNSFTRKSMSRAYDNPTGSNIGDAVFDVGMNSLNFLGLPFSKAIKGIKKYSKPLINSIDNAIYPTRTYRAEIPGGNEALYDASELSKKVFSKGDFSTKSLDEARQYLAGSEATGRQGLLTGQDMNLTEYKVPFWKKDVSFDPDVVALKNSQGVDINTGEYLIPRNKLLYPRKTTVIKAVPEELKTVEPDIFSGSGDLPYSSYSIPIGPSSNQFASKPYRYIEDQINAVTGHNMPLTYKFDPTLNNQVIPMMSWKQPQFPVNKRFKKGGDLPPKVGVSYLPKGERSYYDPIMDNINLDLNASEAELNHEMVHAWQNRQDGFRSDPYSPKLRPSAAASDEQAATYFNRKGDDVDRYINNLNTIVPELGGHTWNEDINTFMPDQIKYDKVIDPLMYSDPDTLEGEAEYMAQVYGRPPLEIRKYGGLHKFIGGGPTDCYWEGSEWNEELQGCVCAKGLIWSAEEDKCIKVQKLPETTVSALGKKPDNIEWYESWNPRKWGLNDYSEYSSFDSAFKNAAKSKEPTFVYKGKRYTTLRKEDKLKQEKEFKEALEYTEDYMQSPKYKEMLKRSSDSEKEYKDITKDRFWNLKNIPSLEIISQQPEDMLNTNAYSRTADGQITMLPLGFDSPTGTYVHELSHSVDRPNIMFGNRNIPESDRDYINKHKAKSLLESRNYKNDKQTYTKADFNAKDKEFTDYYTDYVGEATETRARLNSIRESAKKNNLYDPFTQGVSPELYYNKLKDFEFDEPSDASNPMYQLKGTYSDEEIIWMLNNISKNENEQEEGIEEGVGKKGGYIETELTPEEIEEYRRGGFTVEEIY